MVRKEINSKINSYINYTEQICTPRELCEIIKLTFINPKVTHKLDKH